MIETSVRMNLEHYHDFYILHALQAGIRSEVGNNPEKMFSKAVEKLTADVELTSLDIVPNIALRSFVYLYAACLGEARHARESLAKESFIPETIAMHREGLYRAITEYRPTPSNINILISVFSQKWSSGFGGKAWRNIAEALKMYFTHPAEVFVDHIIDLEHNGGCVFNKSDARDSLHFAVEYPESFKGFLDWKFRYDVLQDKPGYMREEFRVSRKVRKLVTRFCNIFSKKDPYWMKGTLPALDEYIVTWGESQLTLEKKWAKDTDVSGGNFPKSSQLFEMSKLQDASIGSMFESDVMALAEQERLHMYEMAGTYLNDKVKKSIDDKVKNWIEYALTACKSPKKDTTYQVLPCKIFVKEYEVSVEIQVPYDGYGTKTENGFFIPTNFYLHYTFFETPETDGHVALESRNLVLYAGNKNWYTIDKKLEAFID